MEFMEIVWLTAVIAFGILEALTFQFISIWFAGGALFALIAGLCGANATWQSIVFVVASALLLVCTRPFVSKMTKNGFVQTNADSLIGKTAVMTRSSDALGMNGEAKADGKYWTVLSADGQPIEKDAVVTVEKIEGVKLIVKR